MESIFINVFLILQTIGLITEGVNLKEDLPVPWTDQTGCGVDDPYYHDFPSLTTICDPDGALPTFDRMITNDLLYTCQEDSVEGTNFTLLLASSIHGNKPGKNTSVVDLLTQKAVESYTLKQMTSVIFLLVSNNPFQVGTWVSESLDSTFTATDRDEAAKNVTDGFKTNSLFPVAVNKLVHFYCQGVRAPPYERSKWEALTFMWIILVTVLIGAVLATVIHLIIVRYKAFHSGNLEEDGELRSTRGRPNLGPLSMEMDDFGSTPFQPSGNLLLSTTDIAAVPQQHSSTANLLES